MPRPPRSSRRTAAKSAAAAVTLCVVAYVAIVGSLYLRQESLIFPANPLPAEHRYLFDQPHEEIRIPVDGATLDAALFRQRDPRGLVFYLHGNRGNLGTWTSGLDFYRRINYDLFIVDYRGYGRSSGTIESESQLHADVRAAFDAIAPRYAGKPIVVYGRSLGTGLAVKLARDVAPRLLVLVSPYTSLVEAGLRRYPFVPAFLMKYPIRTDTMIGEVRSPVLLLHGTADQVIPSEDSVALRARVRAPVELVLIDGAGHGDIHRDPRTLEVLADRLGRAAGG